MPRRAAAPLRLVLEAETGEKLHLQIGSQLRRAILERRLAAGSRLPSSRVLAGELACARGTILAAFDQLIAEGYIVSRQGAGLFVATDLPDEMLAAPAGPSPSPAGTDVPVLPVRTRVLLREARTLPTGAPAAFPLGQPDREAFPFALWARLLEQEWCRPSWQIAGEPHPFGHPGLRAAIAAYLGAARGFTCDASDVVVTAGVRQGVALFARVVLEAGEAAWIEEPGYAGMRDALAAACVRAVPVPVDAAGFAPEAALTLAPQARLAVVAPAHHFPLGTVLSLQRRLALLAWAARAGGWIVEDDFDGEYRYAGRPLAPLRALDRTGRVAYLGSFSKLLFPALRLSFLVLPAALADATEQILERVSVPAPLLGQGALARFIADGHFSAHLRRTRLLYAARQQALTAAARDVAGLLDVAPDSGGMHLVARLPDGCDDVAATTAAASAGVRVAPLSACYAGPDVRHGLLLGYAGTPEREIAPALRRLAAAVDYRAAPGH